jgi:hypothetical protein
LLTAALSVTSAGAVDFVSNTASSTVGLVFNSASQTYTFSDSEGVSAGTVAPAFVFTQLSGTEATLSPINPSSQGFTGLTFDQTAPNITYSVTSLGTATTFSDASLPASSPGTNTYELGVFPTALSSISAPVTIALTKASAAITVNDSAGTGPTNATLAVNSTSGLAQLTGLSPAAISYDINALGKLTIDTGTGANILSVNFANGNPIAADTEGLAVNGQGSSSQLILENGSFATDTYSPAIPGLEGGSVLLTDNSLNTYPITFTGLVALSDVLDIASYQFTAPTPTPTYPISQQGYEVDLEDGPFIDANYTAEIASAASPAIFTTLNYANKTNVIIDLIPIWQSTSPADAKFVDSNTLTANESTLSVLLGQGDDTVAIDATAPDVSTTINTGGGNDQVTVVGSGLAPGTTSSNFQIDGGTGPNTLQLNVTGTTVNLASPGVAAFGNSTSFAYSDFSSLAVLSDQDNTPPAVTPGAAVTTAVNVPIASAVVATFTDSDTIENATSYTATIEWGDGTVSAGSIAFTGTSTIGGATVNDYAITGNHTYTTAGAHPTTVLVSDLGGTFNSTAAGIPVVTTLPALAAVTGTGATVDVNAIAAGAFTTPEATAGTLASFPALFTFTDNPAPLSAAAYTATINWGDGSPSSAGTISFAGGVFTVSGAHDYGQTGAYTITVIVNGDGQQLSASTAPGDESVVGLSITPYVGLTTTAGTPSGPLTVASFTGTTSPGGYSALIDWGDGDTPTAATTSATAPFAIETSGHTYAQGGDYTISITVRDSQGFVVGSSQTSILVGVSLSGRLSPQSDSGVSSSDGITNVNTPTFIGNTAPGASILVFAAPSGSSGIGNEVAAGSANGAGVWSATVGNSQLADGSYAITAEAVDSAGDVLASSSLGTVVIDTVAPVIDSLTFNRSTDTITVTYQASISGIDYASITNSSFYHLSASPVSNLANAPATLLPTSISYTPGSSPTSPVVVKVVFRKGRPVSAGRYLITIDSGSGDSGVQDVAGNALDGNFYGPFPTGDGLPGRDFAAEIFASGNKIYLEPLKDGYVPPSAATDPPAKTKPVKTTPKPKTTSKPIKKPANQQSAYEKALQRLISETKPGK